MANGGEVSLKYDGEAISGDGIGESQNAQGDEGGAGVSWFEGAGIQHQGDEKKYADVIVRVKRKLADQAVAPLTLVLPHKRSRKSASLVESMGNLGVSEQATGQAGDKAEEGNLALVCALVEKGSGRDLKRKASDELDIDSKRSKLVDLQFDKQGIAPRTLRTSSDSQLDFAVFHAYQTGQLIVALQLLEDPRRDVNFQRSVDGVSVLMAACAHCDEQAVARLVTLGADPYLKDLNGLDSFQHIGRTSELVPNASKTRIQSLLSESEFVYDLYVVKADIDIKDVSTQQQKSSDVWTDQGETNAWTEAPTIANFELDLDRILDEQHMNLDDRLDDESSADEEDYENEDDAHYIYNDYPDEESECSRNDDLYDDYELADEY